jgi:predicted metal-dependent phosphoesterase TrpH
MIDLHCHSTFSDGSDPPEALVLAAAAAGISALALTDHDSVDGIERFLAMQPQVTVRLIAGVEISCIFLGRSLHVLGLFVDHRDAALVKRLEGLRELRNRRNRGMVERLNALGVPLRIEQVLAFAHSCVVSRVHFAMALAATGLVSSPEEAFRRWIGDGGPAYVPREELQPEEAALWIREAGGVPLVAHPGRFAGRNFRWDDAMLDLRSQGMAGFEAWYSDYGPAEERYFLELAARTGMLPSGGSDYHGTHKPGLQLGSGRGTLRVPDSALENLERSILRPAFKPR